MDLYQEIILDHYKHPRNQGEIQQGARVLSCNEANVGCGDEFLVALYLDELMEKVVDVKWQGHGCAISTSSMSLLSEYIKGKTIDEIKLVNQDAMLEMLGLEEITPAREKCMMLSVKAVHRALQNK